jgi:diacylglycerol kinase (ATP)
VNALLVTNPRAGRVRTEARLRRLEQALTKAGLQVRRVEPPDAASTPEAITAALLGRSPDDTRVVIAGGDGSIRAALPALINTPFAVAVLPVGSVNVLARELGLPLDVAAAARLAAGGRPRRLDIGLANGRPFTLMAGMGFDAAVVHAVTRPAKRVFGSFAYVGRGLDLAFRYVSSRCRLIVDGAAEERMVWLAIVTNVPRYTYSLRISPGARADDGALDLALFEGESRSLAARQVIAVLRGSPHCPGILHRRGRSFRFEFTPPVHVQLDGDPAGTTPLEVTVAPRALSVIVPPERADGDGNEDR